jgi:hypothetical protein
MVDGRYYVLRVNASSGPACFKYDTFLAVSLPSSPHGQAADLKGGSPTHFGHKRHCLVDIGTKRS